MYQKGLCGLTPPEIHSLIKNEGYSFSHALSVAQGLYRKRIADIREIPSIPKTLKSFLYNNFNSGLSLPESTVTSADKTVKYLFSSGEGKVYETVYMPDLKRNSVCVSTQSGCRMGCPFCVTARYGFHGDLSAGEIVNQVISLPDTGSLTHVVFMGMGEPMDNIGAVLKSCEIITSQWGLSISPGNVTVSTVGITPGIEAFLDRSECNLTVSLYSPFEEERVKVIPAEKKYPVHEIIEIMRKYPLKKKRRLSLAYVMIKNINDSDRHLDGLKKLVNGSKIRINIIPYHSGRDDKNISSSDERMQYFKHNLVVSGISASIRKTRGADISAACGLLASGFK